MTALCTCPIPESGLTIHFPRCGHPSWDDEDADPNRLILDAPWDALGGSQAEATQIAARGSLPAPVVFRGNDESRRTA